MENTKTHTRINRLFGAIGMVGLVVSLIGCGRLPSTAPSIEQEQLARQAVWQGLLNKEQAALPAIQWVSADELPKVGARGPQQFEMDLKGNIKVEWTGSIIHSDFVRVCFIWNHFLDTSTLALNLTDDVYFPWLDDAKVALARAGVL